MSTNPTHLQIVEGQIVLEGIPLTEKEMSLASVAVKCGREKWSMLLRKNGDVDVVTPGFQPMPSRAEMSE